MPDMSGHRLVITAIHDDWPIGEPFAIHEIVKKTGLSTSTVIRTMRKLVELRLVIHSRTGFKGKKYKVNTSRWTGRDSVLEAYEYARAIGL